MSNKDSPSNLSTSTEHRMALRRVPFGRIHADAVDLGGALDYVAQLINDGRGGYVVTPNVDHVCLAEKSPALVAAYQHAALSLVDGMPLVWLARALGEPITEKVSGSDIVAPLCARAAREGWRVYLLGAAPGVGLRAATELEHTNPGLRVVGVDSPALGFESDAQQNGAVLERIRAADPNVVLVALGCPKQELWMYHHASELGRAVLLGIGATLDFVAGEVRRCPRWMSQMGLEWTYRLAQEPRRMVSRYLVRDRAIVPIAWRQFWQQKRKPRAGDDAEKSPSEGGTKPSQSRAEN